MAVYVNELLPCVPNENWKYDKSCHLVADSFEELMAFAPKIGILRRWVQPDATQRKQGALPHFVLTETMRARAVNNGAIAIDRYQLVAIARTYREMAGCTVKQ